VHGKLTHANPAHHGTEEIPPPPPKKSMLDRARNSIARVAAQIRTGHCLPQAHPQERFRPLLAVRGGGQNSAQDVPSSRAAELSEPPGGRGQDGSLGGERSGKCPVRRLLADPRWEKRLVHFLELSGVGRTLADGVDEESAYAARMDTWVAWETEEAAGVERLTPRGDG
jgi:hypothetical protein